MRNSQGTGFGTFAPRHRARGRTFGARGRLASDGAAPVAVVAGSDT